MVTIEQLTHLTNVSRKQMNNRVLALKHRYPKIIGGGGKGKRGKYKIHPIMAKVLTRPNRGKNTSIVDLMGFEFEQSKFLESLNQSNPFGLFNWRWFCCYSPPKIYESQKLIDLIPLKPNDISFYSIHGRNNLTKGIKDSENLHIHFVIDTEQTKKELSSPKICLDPDITDYRPELSQECFHYFTNPSIHRSENQYIVEYGYLMNITEKRKSYRISFIDNLV
jgi:hypothetical protein